MDSPILETRHDSWPDEAACADRARMLARHDALHDAFIELHGPLGAGKTTFVSHLLHGLGVQGSIKSPTYALLEPYRAITPRGAFAIAHFDFYRFDDPQEWEDAGFRDVFATKGLKLVEWPEKAEGLLPQADVELHIEPRHGEQRHVRFDAHTPRGAGLLE